MKITDYAKLILSVLSILIEVVKDAKAGGVNSDSIVDGILNLKEIKETGLAELAPEVKEIVKKIRELRNTIELPK
jgi:hypothetical protein